MIYTAETVTRSHPDKICDQVADAILDECLKQDPLSRVAVEVLGGHNNIYLVGEITTKANVKYREVAQNVYRELTGKGIDVTSNIVKQSPNIAQGVDTGGAGDQGIMVGYACDENEEHIPNEMYLARKILKPFLVDGKSQVTTEDGKVVEAVLSVQGKTQSELQQYLRKFHELDYDVHKYCNNTGSFDIGGFDSDTGCTGRKIVVDAYGPRVPVGGGAFSGKDPTKVDRSGAYMARWIALNYLNRYQAKEVLVKLAYVIGKPEPVMKKAVVDGKEIDIEDKLDCRPQSIIEQFDLRKPIYLDLARNGHFGRKELPWEKIQ